MSCRNAVISPSSTAIKHLHFPGIRSYRQGDLIQTHLASHLLKSRIEKYQRVPSLFILTFEFDSIYTGGRRERYRDNSSFPFLGVPYLQTARGGEITYHGPGQLVLYPILDLVRLKLKSKCYIDQLQKSIKATLAEYGVRTVDSENTGVWVDSETKISSIGVNVQRSITSHGISINNDPDLKFFNDKGLTICGLPETKQTSIMELKKQCPSLQELGTTFLDQFCKDLALTNLKHYTVDQQINESNVASLDDFIYGE